MLNRYMCIPSSTTCAGAPGGMLNHRLYLETGVSNQEDEPISNMFANLAAPSIIYDEILAVGLIGGTTFEGLWQSTIFGV